MEGLAKVIRNCLRCGVNFEMLHHGDYWCYKCSQHILEPESDEE